MLIELKKKTCMWPHSQPVISRVKSVYVWERTHHAHMCESVCVNAVQIVHLMNDEFMSTCQTKTKMDNSLKEHIQEVIRYCSKWWMPHWWSGVLASRAGRYLFGPCCLLWGPVLRPSWLGLPPTFPDIPLVPLGIFGWANLPIMISPRMTK